MKNKPVPDDADPLDREIDFSKSHPNRFWLGVVDRQCVRLIDKDLAKLFPDNASVNAALRAIADAAQRAGGSRMSARRASVSKKKIGKLR